jgi:hypothetical protein
VGLTPDERRALAQIETQLSGSDPQLAAKFIFWTTQGAWTRSVLVFLGRCRPAPGEFARSLVITAGLAVAIGVAIAGVLTTSPAGPPGRNQGPGGEVVHALNYLNYRRTAGGSAALSLTAGRGGAR